MSTPEDAASAPQAQPQPQPQPPTFRRWMSSMWLYTGLRVALFLVIWGVLVLVGLSSLFAALLALVLSVPLSFVLLARPRERLAGDLQARMTAQRVRREQLDQQLDPDAAREPDDLP